MPLTDTYKLFVKVKNYKPIVQKSGKKKWKPGKGIYDPDKINNKLFPSKKSKE